MEFFLGKIIDRLEILLPDVCLLPPQKLMPSSLRLGMHMRSCINVKATQSETHEKATIWIQYALYYSKCTSWLLAVLNCE